MDAETVAPARAHADAQTRAAVDLSARMCSENSIVWLGSARAHLDERAAGARNGRRARGGWLAVARARRAAHPRQRQRMRSAGRSLLALLRRAEDAHDGQERHHGPAAVSDRVVQQELERVRRVAHETHGGRADGMAV